MPPSAGFTRFACMSPSGRDVPCYDRVPGGTTLKQECGHLAGILHCVDGSWDGDSVSCPSGVAAPKRGEKRFVVTITSAGDRALDITIDDADDAQVGDSEWTINVINKSKAGSTFRDLYVDDVFYADDEAVDVRFN